MSTSKCGLVIETTKENAIKELAKPTLVGEEKGESESRVRKYIFDPEVAPKSLTNEYRKNMILLDIQSRILKEIPAENNLPDILEIDSVKEAFKTMGDAIMIALKSDSTTEINQSMRSVIALSQSVVKLFTSKISEEFKDYVYNYLYEVSMNIREAVLIND